MACSLVARFLVCPTLGEGLVAPASAAADVVGWGWFGAGAAAGHSGSGVVAAAW